MKRLEVLQEGGEANSLVLDDGSSLGIRKIFQSVAHIEIRPLELSSFQKKMRVVFVPDVTGSPLMACLIPTKGSTVSLQVDGMHRQVYMRRDLRGRIYRSEDFILLVCKWAAQTKGWIPRRKGL